MEGKAKEAILVFAKWTANSQIKGEERMDLN
jgi:hypothetical protein